MPKQNKEGFYVYLADYLFEATQDTDLKNTLTSVQLRYYIQATPSLDVVRRRQIDRGRRKIFLRD